MRAFEAEGEKNGTQTTLAGSYRGKRLVGREAAYSVRGRKASEGRGLRACDREWETLKFNALLLFVYSFVGIIPFYYHYYHHAIITLCVNIVLL